MKTSEDAVWTDDMILSLAINIRETGFSLGPF